MAESILVDLLDGDKILQNLEGDVLSKNDGIWVKENWVNKNSLPSIGRFYHGRFQKVSDHVEQMNTVASAERGKGSTSFGRKKFCALPS